MTRVGVMDRSRLVLQDQLDALGGPTGRIEVRTPDLAQAAALLVRAGVRVEHLAAERRELEDVVLAAAGTAGERTGAA